VFPSTSQTVAPHVMVNWCWVESMPLQLQADQPEEAHVYELSSVPHTVEPHETLTLRPPYSVPMQEQLPPHPYAACVQPLAPHDQVLSSIPHTDPPHCTVSGVPVESWVTHVHKLVQPTATYVQVLAAVHAHVLPSVPQ
jgi:hypothetical protein